MSGCMLINFRNALKFSTDVFRAVTTNRISYEFTVPSVKKGVWGVIMFKTIVSPDPAVQLSERYVKKIYEINSGPHRGTKLETVLDKSDQLVVSSNDRGLIKKLSAMIDESVTMEVVDGNNNVSVIGCDYDGPQEVS